MGDIEELKRMLESRSGDFGRMRSILAAYLLGADAREADFNRRMKVAEDALRRSADRHCAKCAIFDGKKCGHSIDRVDCIGGLCRRALRTVRGEGAK